MPSVCEKTRVHLAASHRSKNAAPSKASAVVSPTAVAFTLRLILILALVVINAGLFLIYEEHSFQQHTSSVTYLRAGISRDRVQVRMRMGVQDGPVPCPKGMYRPPGAGPSRGECRFCPRGVYGDSPGLVSSDCTARCPRGTYQDKLGATSVLDCKLCPAGVVGTAPGLTSSACSAPCPLGKYSMIEGLQSLSECQDCPPNYRGPQGRRGNNPVFGWEGGYPCDRFINGKTISTGRDTFNLARLDAIFASDRQPHNKRIDNS